MIKTKQFRHQEELFQKHPDDRGFALFWEPGLGKTKQIFDVASNLHAQQRITGLLVVAPNAVYTNWLSIEAPIHLGTPYGGMAYKSAGSKKEKSLLKQLIFLDPSWDPEKLRLLVMPYSALRTDRGFEFAQKFTLIYKTMMVVDESTSIASHKTDQTVSVKKIGARCHYRWIASGTPAAEGPFKLHSQIEFLFPDFWKNYGLKSFGAFKNEFGEFEIKRGRGGKNFPELRSYRRLDKLQKMIEPISSRLLKEDSGVELPPKLYTRRVFEMSEEQRRVYNSLKYQFLAELDNGMYLEAPLAIVRLTRLQQITSGFVSAESSPSLKEDEDSFSPRGELSWNPDGDQMSLPYTGEVYDQIAGVSYDQMIVDDPFVDDSEVKPLKIERHVVDLVAPEENPRLQLLMALLEERHHKVIVWCRFKRDVEIICKTLGDKCLRYDGSVKQKERLGILNRFRDPSDQARVFVANVHAISQGVTLTIAKTMIYYSNSSSLEKRLQSEDRFHRIGQDSPVQIIDIEAEDTVDGHIINSMVEKYEIAAQVTGDKLREWIKNEV
jgi:SNF2 family DNA or RNA helicase